MSPCPVAKRLMARPFARKLWEPKKKRPVLRITKRIVGEPGRLTGFLGLFPIKRRSIFKNGFYADVERKLKTSIRSFCVDISEQLSLDAINLYVQETSKDLPSEYRENVSKHLMLLLEFAGNNIKDMLESAADFSLYKDLVYPKIAMLNALYRRKLADLFLLYPTDDLSDDFIDSVLKVLDRNVLYIVGECIDMHVTSSRNEGRYIYQAFINKMTNYGEMFCSHRHHAIMNVDYNPDADSDVSMEAEILNEKFAVLLKDADTSHNN